MDAAFSQREGGQRHHILIAIGKTTKLAEGGISRVSKIPPHLLHVRSHPVLAGLSRRRNKTSKLFIGAGDRLIVHNC
jgi:hypothetical protein